MTSDVLSIIQSRFAPVVIGTHQYRGQPTVVVRREGLRELASWLRDEPSVACDFLMDLTAADYLKFGRTLHSAPTLATPAPLPYYMNPKPSTETWDQLVSHDAYRFEVVYHLYSSGHNCRLRLKVPVTAGDPVVDSLADLWSAANWFEREVWDMFGIRFSGHPNLKRILMYEEFIGHPLRKDYPTSKRQPLVGPMN